MAKYTMTVEGDDLEELKTNLQEAAEGLGAEGGTKEEAEEDLTGEGGAEEGGDDAEAQRETMTKAVRAMTKKPGGPDKIRAALKKVGAKVLSDVDDDKLPRVAKLLGIKL